VAIEFSTWIKIARQLPLTRGEIEIVRRFEEDPTGRQFLPLSELLRNHNLVDESLELLLQGVQDHPGFAIARVVLMRELFNRGKMVEAWGVMEKAPMPLNDNVLALKLKFKMSILFGDETTARTSFQQLKIQQGVDPEVNRLMELVESEGVVSCRDSYKSDLSGRGIQLSLPITTQTKIADPQRSSVQPKAHADSLFRQRKFVLEYELDEKMRRDIDNFRVVQLPDVFSPESVGESKNQSRHSVELDSTTLAEIYTKQGVYGKALAIYQRLLGISPHNDLLRMKVAELSRLDKEQRQIDQETEQTVIERKEIIEVIERQERFLIGLLETLNQPR
jgi:hypothetical protein